MVLPAVTELVPLLLVSVRLGPVIVIVSDTVLLLSLLSLIFSSRSTVAILVRLPVLVGVEVMLNLKLLPAPMVTEPPLAIQARVPELLLQLIVPVTLPVVLTAPGSP